MYMVLDESSISEKTKQGHPNDKDRGEQKKKNNGVDGWSQQQRGREHWRLPSVKEAMARLWHHAPTKNGICFASIRRALHQRD
jgi:hypothetical protein